MNRIILLAALAMALLVGCKKKPKDAAPDSTPPPASSTPAPGSSPGGGGGSTPAGGMGIVVNPGAALGGGGGGAAQAVRKAARRTQALNELKNLGELIEGMRDPFGKMPMKEQILGELKKSAPTILKAIEEGSYVLTGTSNGGGLWAYELDADKRDGVALIAGVAQRSSADEVRKLLTMN